MSEQSRQLQEIINAVPVGVAVLDEALHVQLANAAAVGHLALLGYTDTDAALTQLGDQPLAPLMTAGGGGRHRILGGERAYEIMLSPIASTWNGSGWMLVIDDVTQAREVELQAQTQDRLAAIGQLAAGIAHDFNNILAVIVLHAQIGLLQSDLAPGLRECLDIILGQSVRAGDLVQQVLDFSRRAVLERRPLRLGPFVYQQVKLLSRTLPDNIVVRFQDELADYTVNADPTRLQQVIVNLALNARDAMARGGELGFALDSVVVDHSSYAPLPELRPGKWVRLRITDTGHGIPAHVLPHIFEPFFTTKAPLGTGLGLAQVHGIVKQHEGEIDVVSRAGGGTSFALYFPATQAVEVEVVPAAEEPLLLGQGETILVAEDDRAVRMALVATLEQLEYQPLEARNGVEALNLLLHGSHDIALVLSDLIMPEMGGQALQQAMRQQKIATPVIFLSGHPMEMEPLLADEQGLTGWLQKPVNLETLAKTVSRMLAARR